MTAQNDAQKKLYVVSKYTVIMVAGSGELGARIMDQVISKVRGTEGVTPIMEATREQVRASYKEWFPQFAIQPLPNLPVPVRPELALLITGYDVDATTGEPKEQRMYSLISPIDFAPALHNYGFSLLGVAQYALYLLNRLYQPNSTVEQLRSLAAYVITETASQDGKVGGPVRMATIVPSTGCKELSPAEVDTIVQENQRRSEALKDSFFRLGEKT